MVCCKKMEINNENIINIDSSLIPSLIKNTNLINLIRENFLRLSKKNARKILELILKNKRNHKVDIYINSSFKIHNRGCVEKETNFLKKEIYENIRKKIKNFIECNSGIKLENITSVEEIDNTELSFTKSCNNNNEENNIYKVNKYSLYDDFKRLICDEEDDAQFKYDFDLDILEVKPPNNIDNLQRSNLQIINKGIKFDYPINYSYFCYECENKENHDAYKVASTKNKIYCNGFVPKESGDGIKRCKIPLYPNEEETKTREAYYYIVSYEDPYDKHIITAGSISFLRLKPGYFEFVYFKINNPKQTELFFLIDYKNNIPKHLMLPKQKQEENYILTLINVFDKFIEEQTGLYIYGLLPLKISLLLQSAFNHLGISMNFNVQIVGDKSTGKSMILKYYGYLLNSIFHKSTDGLSISVPALRGTNMSVDLMNKKINIISMGYLGTYKSIHIDESGENKELVQNLKTFLLDDNYSYDKAGSDHSTKVRTANINLSENLNHEHIGQYRGKIRKEYKNNDFEIKDGSNVLPKDSWNEDWDLHLPLYMYEWNPYLLQVVKDVRTEYTLNNKYWIDGYELALHDRFPFYFYLVSQKNNEDMFDYVFKNMSRNIISEKMEIQNVLSNDSLEVFYESLKPFLESLND